MDRMNEMDGMDKMEFFQQTSIKDWKNKLTTNLLFHSS